MLAQGASPTGFAAAREGIAALRARVWLVALFAIVGLSVGAFLGVSASIDEGDKGYRAVLVSSGLAGNTALFYNGISTPPGPQLADFAADPVINRVARVTGHSREYLLPRLVVDQSPIDSISQTLIECTAYSDSTRSARELLTAWLGAIKDVRYRYVQRILGRGEWQFRIERRRTIRESQVALRKQIDLALVRLHVLRGTVGVDYTIVRAPRPVDGSPQTGIRSKLKSAFIGGLGGLIAGIALALIVALLDGRLRTVEGIETAFGVPILADLRPPGGSIPSAEHARERLKAIGGGRLPSPLLIVPCGSANVEARDDLLTDALGDGVDVRVSAPVGQPGLVEGLASSGAWVAAASLGKVSRADVAALRAELSGVGPDPAGILIV